MVNLFSHSDLKTKKIAEILAKEIIKIQNQKGAFVLGLKGDLGGGKTTFLQGFALGLGIKERVLSPTFVILKKFTIPKKRKQYNFDNFYHIDCYRIDDKDEIFSLDLKKIILNPKNIVAIEWIDRIIKFLPQKDILMIRFKFIDKNKREIKLNKFKNIKL